MNWILCALESSAIVVFSLLPIPLLAGHDGEDFAAKMFDHIDEICNGPGPYLP